METRIGKQSLREEFEAFWFGRKKYGAKRRRNPKSKVQTGIGKVPKGGDGGMEVLCRRPAKNEAKVNA